MAALLARLFQGIELRVLLGLEIGELHVLGGKLRIELGEAAHVVLDQVDLAGARAPEVTVVDEHAPGERRILLVEEELQRLLAADQVGGAHLPGKRGAGLHQLLLARALLGGECGTA